jgi:hypothetical protein
MITGRSQIKSRYNLASEGFIECVLPAPLFEQNV